MIRRAAAVAGALALLTLRCVLAQDPPTEGESAPPTPEVRPGDGVLLMNPDGTAAWESVAEVRERFPETKERLPEALPPHVGAIVAPPRVTLPTDGWRGIAEHLCQDWATGGAAAVFVCPALQALPTPAREGLVEVAAGSAYASTEVRGAAVELLVWLEGPDADASLARIALESPSRTTRAAAVRRLLGGKRPLPACVLAAIGSEALASLRALEIVRCTRDPSALPHIMTALQAHEDRTQRSGLGLRTEGAGVDSLGIQGGTIVVPFLGAGSYLHVLHDLVGLRFESSAAALAWWREHAAEYGADPLPVPGDAPPPREGDTVWIGR